MPELPEIETTKRGISPIATGQRVETLKIYQFQLRWPVPLDLTSKVTGKIIQEVSRRARYLLFRLDQGHLIFHFGMTGSLRALPADSWQEEQRKKHDHLTLLLNSGYALVYHDPRRFGAVLYTEECINRHPLLVDLGPEPLNQDFHADYLHAKLKQSHKPIKLALMDNRLVVGVGNIYSNEALFRARISPLHPSNQITLDMASQLVFATKTILLEAIAKGGSTLRDYVNGSGEPGYFQQSYSVYGRSQKPCLVCSTTIQKVKQAGRSSFYCLQCQR